MLFGAARLPHSGGNPPKMDNQKKIHFKKTKNLQLNPHNKTLIKSVIKNVKYFEDGKCELF